MITKRFYYDRDLQRVVEQVIIPKDISAPNIISDDIEPTESLATDEGLVFTSKSALRAHYKQHGFEDTGGDHLLSEREHKANIQAFKDARKIEIRKEVEQQLNKLKWGMAPLTEKEKYICQQEERRYKRKG